MIYGSLEDAAKKKVYLLEELHLIFSAWNNITKCCIATCFVKSDFAKFFEQDKEHNIHYGVPLKDYAFTECNIIFSEFAKRDKLLIISETDLQRFYI